MYDVVVVGGGVVGCAVFRELTLRGYNVLLLEKNEFLVQGASCGNSGIACTGYDAPKGSLEQQCIRRGIQLNARVYRDLGLPSVPCGSLVVAWTEEEFSKLPSIAALNHELGDHLVKVIDGETLYSIEPSLAQGALGAVLVPGEVVVEPWLIPIAYVHHGIANGGNVLTSHCVASGEFVHGHKYWRVKCTNDVVVNSKCVVNCAGNYGDIVEAINKPNQVPFKITPRKGQFVVFGGNSVPPLNHVIQPVPTHRTKGVFIFKTIYNQIIVGPTAEDQEQREHPVTDPNVLKKLHAYGCQVLPSLSKVDVVGSYAGLRPATQFRDYQIGIDVEKQWITVAGIRSTGVTASLGIAEYVVQNLVSQIPELKPVQKPTKPYRLPPVEELAMSMHPRNFTVAAHGTQGTLKVDHAITQFGWLALQDKIKASSRL